MSGTDQSSENVPLISAYGGSMEFVVSFLKAGGSIDYMNSNGETMLHAAAEGWQHQMINFLLIWGANVNGQDRFGNTPLHRLTLTREPPGPLTAAEPKESDFTKHRLAH
jgi:ankyrin repeat protein